MNDFGWNPNGWNLISIPVDVPRVSTQRVPDTEPFFDYASAGFFNGGNYDFYHFNQKYNGQEWRNYRVYEAQDSAFVAERNGYLYANHLPTTLSFTGYLYTLDKKEYSYLRYDSIGPKYRYSGYNLVGNPYPCNATVETGSWETIGENGSYLHLIDNATGADIDLLRTPTYTFNSADAHYAARFKIVFAEEASNDIADSFAFISNGELIITGTGTLQVFDMLGRQLFARKVNSSLQIPNSSLNPGVYVLRLCNGKDVKTQKIVVE